MPFRPSPAVVPTVVALATVLELLAALAVVHRLVRQPMRVRGLPTWRPSDTLLTSPLFFAGAALFLGGMNGGIVALAYQASAAVSSPTPWFAVSAAGLLVGAFGVRGFGKLY